MEPLVPLFFFAVIAAGLVSTFAGGRRWEEIATELGLEFSNGFQRSLSGTLEGFNVEVIQRKNHLEIEVSSSAIKRSIGLSREGFLSGVLGGRDIEIGCPTFDPITYVSSYSRNSEAEVAALLDSKARAAVSLMVVQAEAKVAGGRITHSKSNDIKEVPSLLGGLIRLARHLTMENFEIPDRLAANALGDPVSSVRLRNLTLLQERFRSNRAAAETSAALLADSNDSIRLAAAMFVDTDEGLGIVREIAQSRPVLIDLRIKALRHLTHTAESGDMVEIAAGLLADRDARLQRMAIECLGSLQHRSSLEAILALLKRAEVATILEIVKAIENIGASTAEAALVELLGHDNNRVKTAAIGALGKVGTVTAVESLHALTKRLGFKRSARVAIDSIQSRLGDVETGRLSLAPAVDPDGALSLAGDPDSAGALSISESDRGDPSDPSGSP